MQIFCGIFLFFLMAKLITASLEEYSWWEGCYLVFFKADIIAVIRIWSLMGLVGEESTFFRSQDNLIRKQSRNSHFLWAGSWCAPLSVFSRSSVGVFREGIREGKETAILIKVLFSILEFLGRSLVYLWFVLGLWHGVYILKYKGTES